MIGLKFKKMYSQVEDELKQVNANYQKLNPV